MLNYYYSLNYSITSAIIWIIWIIGFLPPNFSSHFRHGNYQRPEIRRIMKPFEMMNSAPSDTSQLIDRCRLMAAIAANQVFLLINPLPLPTNKTQHKTKFITIKQHSFWKRKIKIIINDLPICKYTQVALVDRQVASNKIFKFKPNQIWIELIIINN